MLLIGSKKGFTLIEIVIALVLIGIVISIVLPGFEGLLGSIETKTTGRQIVNLLSQVRTRAIIDDTKREIKIEDDKLIYETRTGEKMEFNRQIKKLTLRGEKKKLTFFPTGRSSGGKLIVVTEEGNKFKITVDEVTGQASLEE